MHLQALPQTITESQYTELKARYDRHVAFVDSLRKSPTSMVSYKPEDVPADAQISNAETSQIERYEFIRDRPSRYFSYVFLNEEYPFGEDHRIGTIGTWANESIGRITSISAPQWQYGIARTRVQYLTVIGINGVLYHGRYYPNSGDYVHLTAYKHQEAD